MKEYSYLFAMPINLILFAVTILFALFLYRYYRDCRVVRILGSGKMAIGLSVFGIGMMLIDGVFATTIHDTIIFGCMLYMVLINLLLALCKRRSWNKLRRFIFTMLHVGMVLLIGGRLFGAGDKKIYKMLVPLGVESSRVYNMNKHVDSVDFSIKLEELEILHWDNNLDKPKEFIAEVTINGENNYYIKVNHPIKFSGYLIYQDGYDVENPLNPRYTILRLVKDPWLWVSYVGMIMILLGGVFMMFTKASK